MIGGKCSCGHHRELHRDGRCAGGQNCPCVPAVVYDEDDDRLVVDEAQLARLIHPGGEA